MLYRKSLLLISAGLLAVALVSIYRMAVAAPQPAPASTPTEDIYGLSQPEFRQLASSSCAASACHGGGAVRRKGSEHTTWSPDLLGDGPTDPHSRAFSVLSNAESVRMAKVLGLTTAPSKSALCLSCHSVPAAAPAHTAEGVGCGACHGPAERWLAAHVRPDWKQLTNRDKYRYGFLPGTDLVARNLTCAKCHVGDAEREVNHDLIAAGHPRLTFESARFHFHPGYRKHWVETGDPADFELRTWFVGQLVGMRAATELLRVRAERAASGDKPPWPEFAGYSCYACHKGVGEVGSISRPLEPTPSRPLGNPPWESWATASFDIVSELRFEFYPNVALPELKNYLALRTLMEKRWPEPAAVAAQAAKAVAEIDAWLAAVQAAQDLGRLPATSPDLPRRLANALAVRATDTADWDALAIAYLGCAAGYHAEGGKARVPDWTKPIVQLEAELAFPKDRRGVRFDGPADFGPAKLARVRRQFRDLAEATSAPRSTP